MASKSKKLSKAQIATLTSICTRLEAVASKGVQLAGKGEKFASFLSPLSAYGFTPQVVAIISQFPSLAEQVKKAIKHARATGARNKAYGAAMLGQSRFGVRKRSRKAILTDPSLTPEQVIEELAKLDADDDDSPES